MNHGDVVLTFWLDAKDEQSANHLSVLIKKPFSDRYCNCTNPDFHFYKYDIFFDLNIEIYFKCNETKYLINRYFEK